MPIKDKSAYPANWREISQRTRDLAGNCCEGCGLPNHLIGCRLPGGGFMAHDGPVGSYIGDRKIIRIVCTAAHVDHDTTNNHPSNLKFWCQKCHNTFDAPMRAKHAAETRRARKAATL